MRLLKKIMSAFSKKTPAKRARPVFDADAMARVYRACGSIYEVADIFGCSPATVSRLLRKSGEKMRPRGARRKLALDVGRMATLYRAGLTSYQVAAIVGCSAPTVRDRLRAYGVAIRPKGHAGRVVLS